MIQTGYETLRGFFVSFSPASGYLHVASIFLVSHGRTYWNIGQETEHLVKGASCIKGSRVMILVNFHTLSQLDIRLDSCKNGDILLVTMRDSNCEPRRIGLEGTSPWLQVGLSWSRRRLGSILTGGVDQDDLQGCILVSMALTKCGVRPRPLWAISGRTLGTEGEPEVINGYLQMLSSVAPFR